MSAMDYLKFVEHFRAIADAFLNASDNILEIHIKYQEPAHNVTA
jgi:hypothetical protein